MFCYLNTLGQGQKCEMAVATEISVGAGSLLDCRAAVDLHIHTLAHSYFQCVSRAEWVLFSPTHLTANHELFFSTDFQASRETASRVTLLRNCKSLKASEQNQRNVPTCVTVVMLLISNLSRDKHLLKAYVYYVTNTKAASKFHSPDFYQWFPRTGWEHCYWLLLLLQKRGT